MTFLIPWPKSWGRPHFRCVFHCGMQRTPDLAVELLVKLDENHDLSDTRPYGGHIFVWYKPLQCCAAFTIVWSLHIFHGMPKDSTFWDGLRPPIRQRQYQWSWSCYGRHDMSVSGGPGQRLRDVWLPLQQIPTQKKGYRCPMTIGVRMSFARVFHWCANDTSMDCRIKLARTLDFGRLWQRLAS